MVQIAPNRSVIKAKVLSVKTYDKQEDFNVLKLEIQSSEDKDDEKQMLDSEQDTEITALLSKEATKENKISTGKIISCEVKKVSMGLWKIIEDSVEVM